MVDELIAYYPFNGNANDESGKGNDGTITGATLTSDRYSVPDSAYSFDGTGDVLNTPVSINMENAFSLAFWIKRTATTDWVTARTLSDMFYTYSAVVGCAEITGRYGTSIYFRYGAGGTGSIITSALSVGVWTHYVWVHHEYNTVNGYPGHNYEVYKNGLLVNAVRWEGYRNNVKPNPPDYDPHKFYVGNFSMGRAISASHSFDLDEVKVFNYALTSDEVTSLYQRTVEPAPIDLNLNLIAPEETLLKEVSVSTLELALTQLNPLIDIGDTFNASSFSILSSLKNPSTLIETIVDTNSLNMYASLNGVKIFPEMTGQLDIKGTPTNTFAIWGNAGDTTFRENDSFFVKEKGDRTYPDRLMQTKGAEGNETDTLITPLLPTIKRRLDNKLANHLEKDSTHVLTK